MRDGSKNHECTGALICPGCEVCIMCETCRCPDPAQFFANSSIATALQALPDTESETDQ